jgi:hypothetical protein
MAYEKYIAPKLRGKSIRNGKPILAFVEAPVAFLDTVIPALAKWSRGENAEIRTLRDFTIFYVVSKDGAKCMIRLCAVEHGRSSRDTQLSVSDMNQWDAYLSPYGHGKDTWFGHGVYLRKLTKDYIDMEQV